jgi:hypothetical protein
VLLPALKSQPTGFDVAVWLDGHMCIGFGTFGHKLVRVSSCRFCFASNFRSNLDI